jgi:PAS domain S-box-containing protein
MTDPHRALVLAPNGRDGTLAASLLAEGGHTAETCRAFQDMLTQLEEGAGLAIIAIEALQHADLNPLTAWIEKQPPWSDFPFIILTHRMVSGDQQAMLNRLQAMVGNVIFLDRPFHPSSLVNVVENALRGRRRQYEARKYLDERERLVHALAIERERTQAALLGERALSGLLLTSVPAGIVGYDTNLQVTIWNPVMERLFGVSEKAAVGRPLAELIADGDASKLLPRLQDALGGLPGPIEQIELTTDAGHITLESQHAPLTGGDGNIVGGAAFFRDITERRQVEEQLHHAQKMETIGQLTGGVAHDFNNLLAAVQGNLELLRKRLPDDPQLRRYLDGALQGASRGASLTSRLLAFARKQELNPEATDLKSLLDGMRGLVERSIGPMVRVRFDLQDGLPSARVDANQLELAILNLAVNARDAMPDGGDLIITLNSANGQSEGLQGEFVVVSVSDTGAGMSPETLERAIEPFFSTKELGKGTGLGLSMVHGLAIQLGGKLSLRSDVGSGTTAELWLPLSEFAARSDSPARLTVSNVQPSRILVVDDDVLIAMNTVDLVEDLGHSAVEANSGKAALEILASDAPLDAMITDFAMPGMNGVELAIRARELRPHLPILLASGYAELPSGTELNLPRLGKPFLQEDLEAALSNILMPV